MRTIPIKLDVNKASALYLLIDIALRSLSAEKLALENIQKGEQQSEYDPIKIGELLEHVDQLSEEGKKLSLEIGALVDELEDDDEPFIPVIKT